MVEIGKNKTRQFWPVRFTELSRNYRVGESGFTLLELIITLLIISILAVGAVPVARNLSRKQKERELKRSLREIRLAIDQYHKDCEEKVIDTRFLKNPEKHACYPESLDMLVEGVEKFDGQKLLPTGVIKRYLRRKPIDPMTGRDDWETRSVQDEPDSFGGDQNVYDVRSRYRQLSLDGKTYYSEW
ncbi:MAG: prepilin-type N-terminal cleavage/methylation domain-containing protein [Acidobacteria bacterium]|nr:prepilin-type N-terminal cleavage/methylation domain-containing protein [Acidobacteriota bacterium]